MTREPTPKQRLKCYRNASYLKWIRTLPCASCGDPGSSQAAHVRMGNGGGMGLKPSDYRTLPLCPECHGAQHAGGERTFWETIEKNPDAMMVSALSHYVADVLDLGFKSLLEVMEQTIEAVRRGD